ncbi:MAG: transcriptional regulator [Pseudanabaena sp. CAN_BIN31]|nr:transcriptional regulator [Pseudanabaena sp. CAN_BIN31]
MPDKLTEIIDRIAIGQHTEADIDTLRQIWGMGDRQSLLQLGKYGVNIEHGQDIHIGDRIYVSWNKDAINALIEVIQKNFALPTKIPDNLPRSGVVKFVGRDLVINQLHQMVENHHIGISAIVGMGGVGKTELAIQYVKRYKNYYSGGICWLYAREFNVGTQIVGYAQSQIGLKIPDGLDLLDQVAFCWRNWQQQGYVIIVLDDVVHFTRDVEPYLPPESLHFRLLMTTRLKFSFPIQMLSLDVFTFEKAFEMLESFIGNDRIKAEPETINILCEWLGYLPLGLELVGRYLADEMDLSLLEMLSRLQEKAIKRQALMDQALVREQDNPVWTMTAQRGVAAAFDLSWEGLDTWGQYLGKLLSLCALAPVPWELIETVAQQYFEIHPENGEFNSEELQSARRKLFRFHLIQDLGQKKYLLHSLIREYFRGKLECGEIDVTA